MEAVLEDVVDWRIEFGEVFWDSGGFDIAIANPPYIQLQRDGGRLANVYKNAGYATFTRTGDIYYLFYERAISLLKQDRGYACIISSNQWMRIDSGKILREFILGQNPLRLVNLGAGVFENVTVNTSVLLVQKSSNYSALRGADIKEAAPQFPPAEWTDLRPTVGETWTVLKATELTVKSKIDTVGTPLAHWGVKINRGIVTGYNEAFIVDDATRLGLIAQDPNSADIIKPVLRGRDIQRYRTEWAGLWLITTFPSLQVDIDDFPSVRDYLLSFGKDRLEQSGKALPSGGKSRKKTN